MPFSVTKRPGTRSESTGSRADSLLACMASWSITEMVSGTLLRLTWILFAEMTTPFRLIRLSGSSTGFAAKADGINISPKAKSTFFLILFIFRFL